MTSPVAAPLPQGARPRHLLPPIPWVLGIALLLRIVLIFYKGNRFYFADTAEYAAAARGFLSGQGPGAGYIRAPLYPLFMSLGFRIGGLDNWTAVRLLQLVLSAGVLLLTVALARRAGSAERGGLAAVAIALAPTLIFTGTMLYPTELYTMLLLAATVGVLGLEQRPGVWRAAFAGAAMGLVWLTDAISLVTLGALVLWLLFAARRPKAKTLGMAALALLVAALVALPYESWHRSTYHSPGVFLGKAQFQLWAVRTMPELGGRRLVRDTSRVFRPLPTGRFLGRELDLMKRQPRAYLTDYAREFVHFFAPLPDRLATHNVFTELGPRLVAALYFIPVLVFAAIGLFAGAIRLRYRLLLMVPPLVTAATYAFFFTQTRYRIPIEPELLVLGAVGFVRLWPGPWRAPASVADSAEHP